MVVSLKPEEMKEKLQSKLRKERYNANQKQLKEKKVADGNSHDLSPATLREREMARERSRRYRLRKKERQLKEVENDDLPEESWFADGTAEDEKIDGEIINLASPLSTVTVVERNGLAITPPVKKRGRRAPISANINTHRVNRGRRAPNFTAATEGNTVDLLDCSPGVTSKGVVRLLIEKHSGTSSEIAAEAALESVSNIRQQLEVASPFQESTMILLSTLESLKRPKKRIISLKPEHAVKALLLLGPDENNRETIEASMDAQDIYALLKCRAFISDAPLNYYRCLLIREEMKRALMYDSSEWVRSWIHSTLFMDLLMHHGYEAVKDVDRKFIGKGRESDERQMSSVVNPSNVCDRVHRRQYFRTGPANFSSQRTSNALVCDLCILPRAYDCGL